MKKRLTATLEDLACSTDTQLSLVITDDQGIRVLNEQYLGRQGPTNVLAFPMAEGEFAELNPNMLGDVVVSVEYARKEALENGLDPEDHLYRLMIHGILHLLGHDHVHDQAQARKMEELTEELLEKSRPAEG